MDRQATTIAAKLLIDARRSGNLLDRLPEASRPRNAAEAYAIQLETVAEMGDAVAGWKVAISAQYDFLIGLLVRSRVFESGAAIPAARMAMLGVEAEIAFRFDHALPPRERAYERNEVEAAVTALPAIEIVDSRYRDYHGTAVIDRAADFMSNGAFVAGVALDTWRSLDLANLRVCLTIDGVDIVQHIGGNVAGDPFNLAIALANRLRLLNGVRAGQILTTGTYTGLQLAKSNSLVIVTFEGFDPVTCQFLA